MAVRSITWVFAMTDIDVAYYAKREAQERAFAEQADDPGVAKIHRDLAEHYAAVMGSSSDARQADVRPMLRIRAAGH